MAPPVSCRRRRPPSSLSCLVFAFLCRSLESGDEARRGHSLSSLAMRQDLGRQQASSPVQQRVGMGWIEAPRRVGLGWIEARWCGDSLVAARSAVSSSVSLFGARIRLYTGVSASPLPDLVTKATRWLLIRQVLTGVSTIRPLPLAVLRPGRGAAVLQQH